MLFIFILIVSLLEKLEKKTDENNDSTKPEEEHEALFPVVTICFFGRFSCSEVLNEEV